MRFSALITLFMVLFYCPLDGVAALPERLVKTVQLDSAIQYTEAFLRRPGISQRDRVLATCLLSGNYSRKGNYLKAQLVVRKLDWKIVTACGLEGEVLLKRAIAEKYLVNNETAFNNYTAAIAVFKRLHRKNALAEALIELAEFHRKIQQKDLALERLEEASELLDQIGNPSELQAHYYNRLAAVLNEESRHAESRAASEKSIVLAKRISNPYLEAISCNELAYTMQNVNQRDSVLFYYKHSEQLFRACGAIEDAFLAKANWVRYCINHAIEPGNYEKWLHELEDEAKREHIHYNLRETYFYIQEQAVKRNDYKTAYEYILKDHELEIKAETRKTQIQIQKVREEANDQLIRKENGVIRSELTNSRKILWTISIAGAVILAAFGFIYWLNIQRKRLIRKLTKENAEKNVLIQEVHHRVKNNLQFVGSLLEMQMGAGKSESEISALNEAAMRISSMSLVHEMLYTESQDDTVELGHYVKNLISLLVSMLDIPEGSIEERLNVEHMFISSRHSLSLGIILNELFTNAVKYAFEGVERPVFAVSIVRENRQLRVSVSDNGKGFAGRPVGNKGLGMRLIDIFSRQMNGTYTMNDANGVAFTLIAEL